MVHIIGFGRLGMAACIASLSVAVTACNTTAPVVSTPPPADPMAAPPVGPAPSAAPFTTGGSPAGTMAQPSRPQVLHARQSEKVTASPDGRTIRTETTRTSVSVDANRAAASVGAMLGAASGNSDGSQGVPGTWRAYSSSSRETCTVQLYGPPGAMEGAADSAGCSYGGALQGISGWQFTGGQLLLRKGSATSLTLNPLGPNRYDGQLTWGILRTTISLSS